MSLSPLRCAARSLRIRMLGPAEDGLDLVGIKIAPTADALRPLSFFRGFHLSSELRGGEGNLGFKAIRVLGSACNALKGVSGFRMDVKELLLAYCIHLQVADLRLRVSSRCSEQCVAGAVSPPAATFSDLQSRCVSGAFVSCFCRGAAAVSCFLFWCTYTSPRGACKRA